MNKGIHELNKNLESEYNRKLNKLNNEFKKNIKEITPSSEDYLKLSQELQEKLKLLRVENTEKFEQEEQKLLKTYQMSDKCCICQEQIECNYDLKTLPCGDEFHRNCMATWLQEKQTCPLCRKDCTISDLCKWINNLLYNIKLAVGESPMEVWIEP